MYSLIRAFLLEKIRKASEKSFFPKFSLMIVFNFLSFLTFWLELKELSWLTLRISFLVYKLLLFFRWAQFHYPFTCWAFNVIVMSKLFLLFVSGLLHPLGWFIA